MTSPVIIKGNKYGIVLVLDNTIDFEQLLAHIEEKFIGGVKFFDGKESLAITFQGRNLTNDEISRILEVISNNSALDIQYIIDENSELEEKFKKIITVDNQEVTQPEPESKILFTDDKNDGLFYKGTLRSGQTIEAEGSLVVIGDINPGATVISNGNIIVIGSLNGYAYAGATGNESAFVLAFNMSPIQVRIGEVIARSSDQPKLFKKKRNANKTEPQIAFVENNNIYIEPVSKNVLNDINL